MGCRNYAGGQLPELPMCSAHWRLVPKATKKAVWDAAHYGTETEAWREALTDAIRAVAEAEGRPAPPKYERVARDANGDPTKVLL